VHTRTISDPSWGIPTPASRANTFTALPAEDDGGGRVVIPATGSRRAFQDFTSKVFIGRLRRLGPRSPACW
jgi:hypothetical protein